MKQLGYTSIEQSKKLVEAGLDPNTADMCYDLIEESEWYGFPMSKNLTKDDLVGIFVPCWSLGQLIDLIPYELFISNQDETWFVSFDVDDTHSHQFSGIKLIDTVVDVFVWLLDNGYIKKE